MRSCLRVTVGNITMLSAVGDDAKESPIGSILMRGIVAHGECPRKPSS